MPRTAGSYFLANQRSSQGNGINLRSIDIIYTGNDKASHEAVLIVVANGFEQVSNRLHCGRASFVNAMRGTNEIKTVDGGNPCSKPYLYSSAKRRT